MPKLKCEIPNYVNAKPLPKEEKERLANIHFEIFRKLKASKFFKVSNGNLLTKSQTYFQAQSLVHSVNREIGKTVVSLTKAPIANRRAPDYKVSVDVTPLINNFSPTVKTKEQEQNTIDLQENEPFVQTRFTGKRESVKVVQGKIIADQGLTKDDYLELQEAIYGSQSKNQSETTIQQYKQGKLFNMSSLKRGTQDFGIEEKYFPNGLTNTSGDILKRISESEHPLAKVAKALLKYDPNVPITLVKSNVLVIGGENAAARYDANKRDIHIAKYSEFRGMGSEPTLIHEIMHAATFHYIRKYSSSQEVKSLKQLYKEALQNSNELQGDRYALTSLDEFIVGLFADAQLIKFLKDLPASKYVPETPNLFESIMTHILSLFGITKANKSLYAQSMAVASIIVNDSFMEDSFESQFDGVLFDVQMKNGVQELFESNPELANEVYEALGFKEKSKKRNNAFAETLDAVKNAKIGEQVSLHKIFPHIADAFVTKTKDGNYYIERTEDLLNNQQFEDYLLDRFTPTEKETDVRYLGVTPQQKQQAIQAYSQYLDTVFPDSKVKDIVYHGTNNKEQILKEGFKNNAELFEPDDDRAFESGELGYGYYFTTTQQSAKNYGEPIAVILNNPDMTNETTFNLITNERGLQHFVKTKEQIHILGSKQDIEGFKNFTNQSATYDNDKDKQRLLSVVNYQFKAVKNIIDNIDKIKQWRKQITDDNKFWSKVQNDLQIPKDQIEIIKQQEGNTIEEIITSFAANYSYSVEVNTTREGFSDEMPIEENGKYFIIYKDPEGGSYREEISEDDYIEKSKDYRNRNAHKTYYSNLTVPGGTNYTENEISTPLITPNIKGHAQFSTDNGIGWFRSDEEINNKDWSSNWEDGESITNAPSKTRRILEVQSDLFQKGRDREDLVTNPKANSLNTPGMSGTANMEERLSGYKYSLTEYEGKTEEEANNLVETERKRLLSLTPSKKESSENQFLQLLNKDNNWVNFFVKSIIQDSAKKGYEKVLFPKGDTAAKVEGHTTLEEFKKVKQDRLKEIDVDTFTILDENGNTEGKEFNTEKEAENYINSNDNIDLRYIETKKFRKTEINQLKQELERVEREGFGALRPIYNFYENNVSKILSKQFNTKDVTDEYGNKWAEVDLKDQKVVNATNPIVFNMPSNYQRTATNETIAKVRDLLIKLKVPVKIINNLLEEHGLNGFADGVERFIALAEGAENVALTEEAMHMLTLIAPAEMVQPLLNSIKNYKIYKQTYNQYKTHPAYLNEDGSVNEEKIKLEAVGKLLAEMYIQESEGLSEEEVNVGKTVLARLLDWIKGLFIANHDAFREFLNGVQSGEINLGESHSREERLLSIAFDKNTSEEIANHLTGGLVRSDLTNPARANDPNVKILNELSELMQSISVDDMSFIQNMKEFINLPSKKPFDVSNAKLEAAIASAELMDMAMNSLEYFRTSYTNVQMLSDRGVQIRKMLKDGVTDDGDPLDTKTRLYLFNEISRINDLLEIYHNQMISYNLIFADENNIEGIAEVAASISSVATTAINQNKKLDIQNLTEIFRKHLEPKVANFKKNINKDIIKLQKDLNTTTSTKARNRIQAKIDKLQAEYDNPPVSAENVISLLQDYRPDSRFSSAILSKFMEGGLTHYDEAVQAVANLLADATQEAYKDAAKDIDEYNEIFQQHGVVQNIGNSTYDKFLETVTRKIYNRKNGELETYQEVRMLGATAQWQFENDLSVLEHLVNSYETKGNIDYVDETFHENFDRFLTDDEKLDPVKTLSDIRQSLIDTYGNRRYIDKYYEIREILDNAILSDGRSVRDFRQPFIDRLIALQDELEISPDPITFDILNEEKKELALDLARLESEYDLTTGQKKTGDALLVATAIAEWKKAKRDVVITPGDDPINVDNFYVPKLAMAKWTNERQVLVNSLSSAKALYKSQPNNANRISMESIQTEFDEWRKTNAKTTIPQEFYDERNDILLGIQEIIDGHIKDQDAEDAAKEQFADIWADIFSMTKGLRDENGILDGIEALSLSEKIRDAETSLEELKTKLKSSHSKLTKAEIRELKILLEMLNDIQDTPLTDKWEFMRQSITSQLETDMRKKGLSPTAEEMNAAFYDSDFFKENTIDVTEQYRKKTTANLPNNVIRIGKKTYKPIYTWRATVPKGRYDYEDVPSNSWSQYEVNKAFENPSFRTAQGNIALDENKIPKDPVNPGRYDSPRYHTLSDNDKDFLEKVVAKYEQDQSNKKKSERSGRALPRINSTGIHRKMQILNPANWKFKRWFTKDAWTKESLGASLNQLMGIDTSELEDVYGEDSQDTIRRRAAAAQSKRVKVRVMAKYINKSSSIKTQEKDLFRVLSMYNIEMHRSEKMKELLPAINTISETIDNMSTKKSRRLSLEYEINKRVNKQTRTAASGFAKIADKITDNAHSNLAFTRLFLPWLISASIKNSAMGAYQIWVNASKLRQYGQGSFISSYAVALKRAVEVTMYQYSLNQGSASKLYDTTIGKDSSKYMALVKRLNVVANLDVNDTSVNNVSGMVKLANGLGYISGAQRRISEVHLELTMFELYMKSHKINGVSIMDSFDFVDGKLIPKDNITQKDELEITKAVKEMQQFTQGNFSADNAVYAKQFLLGRILLFMKGYFYNPLMVRAGKRRILASGIEIEGYYRMVGRLSRSNPLTILQGSKGLTANERDGVLKMRKDLVILNIAGALMYQFAEFVKESGDDDEEAPLMWYSLLMARKIYAEASVFNPAEYLGFPFVVANEDNRVRGNAIENFFEYAVGRPAMNLAASSAIPYDFKGLRFEEADIKTKDPYYSQMKDNWVLYNLSKILRTKSDMKYAKSSLSAFEYFDKSIYAYQKDKGAAKRVRKRNSKKRR